MLIDPEQANKLGGAVRLTLLFCGLLSAIVLTSYILSDGWQEYARWGAFGDYVGGILNPIFAFANVVVLVIISYQLASVEESRSKRDASFQSHLAKMQPRYAAIQEVNAFQAEINKLTLQENSGKALRELMLKMRVTLIGHVMLFPPLNTFDNSTIYGPFQRVVTDSEFFQKCLKSARDGTLGTDPDHIDTVLNDAGDTLGEALSDLNMAIAELQKAMMTFMLTEHYANQ